MDYSEVSCDASEDKPSNVKISLKYGKPVYRVTFNAIQFLYTLFILDVTLCIIGAIATLTSSVQVGRHLGHFINLVSNGDGNLVPILEGIPSFLFIVLNIAEFWALWKIFEPDKYSVNMNRILFILILISLGIVLMVIIFMIVILVEIYRPHGQVHDGIIEGMNKYANHSLIKATIDMVQIEFDCCGSKKYDEWYTIPWYEGNIADLNKP
ncbi:unnamed protein product [Brassicogethes aeneus]|uniref:Tetraspanin n=1 Tax=Brassicogethes aeneus TaxID=1431903 RepID=A0A9P0FM93_BRAAE|nr:unnamed protein product [Brassicogethes aeneus]